MFIIQQTIQFIPEFLRVDVSSDMLQSSHTSKELLLATCQEAIRVMLFAVMNFHIFECEAIESFWTFGALHVAPAPY